MCRDKLEMLNQPCSCNGVLKYDDYYEECQLDLTALQESRCEKVAVSQLLRTGMVGTPAQVFTRCHDKDITRIRSHVFGEKSKLTKGVLGYNAKSLCIYCSGDVIVDGQDTLVVNAKLFGQNRIAKFSKDVLKVKSFGFEQVDIDVPDELYDKFSEMAPLSLVQET